MDTFAKVLRDEYKGLGYNASDALDALWTDYRDTNGFEQYRAEVAENGTFVSADELLSDVIELARELVYEIMSAPADIDGVASFRD